MVGRGLAEFRGSQPQITKNCSRRTINIQALDAGGLRLNSMRPAKLAREGPEEHESSIGFPEDTSLE